MKASRFYQTARCCYYIISYPNRDNVNNSVIFRMHLQKFHYPRPKNLQKRKTPHLHVVLFRGSRKWGIFIYTI